MEISTGYALEFVPARTVHFPVALGRMNRLKAVGTFSKVTLGRINLANRLNAFGIFSKITLGRINLAHRLNVVGAFAKVTDTIVDILEG